MVGIVPAGDNTDETLNHTVMLKKSMYSTPETEFVELKFEGNILSNVERVTFISGDDAGEWDEEE